MMPCSAPRALDVYVDQPTCDCETQSGQSQVVGSKRKNAEAEISLDVHDAHLPFALADTPALALASNETAFDIHIFLHFLNAFGNAHLWLSQAAAICRFDVVVFQRDKGEIV
jgi:hypothetical protein